MNSISNHREYYQSNERKPPISSTIPLLNNNNKKKSGAPLALTENTDDEVDDREVVTKPYPGVDDGFFTNDDSQPKDSSDAELIPTRPRDPEDDVAPDIPEIIPRSGPDGGSDNPDGHPTDMPKLPPPNLVPPADRPYRPWGWDFEIGSAAGDIPDLNIYQHKKTLAQGMMDLALFSANANQLRYVLETFRNHPYYYPSVVLIAISLTLQVAVGIGLIWNARYNIKDEQALCRANKVNNATTVCVFLVTVINVFISAFGVAPVTP